MDGRCSAGPVFSGIVSLRKRTTRKRLPSTCATVPHSGFRAHEPRRITDCQRRSRKMSNPIVLVVDDNAIIADTLAIILNQFGFTATAVHSGEEALQIAED